MTHFDCYSRKIPGRELGYGIGIKTYNFPVTHIVSLFTMHKTKVGSTAYSY